MAEEDCWEFCCVAEGPTHWRHIIPFLPIFCPPPLFSCCLLLPAFRLRPPSLMPLAAVALGSRGQPAVYFLPATYLFAPTECVPKKAAFLLIRVICCCCWGFGGDLGLGGCMWRAHIAFYVPPSILLLLLPPRFL
jgi:hypothetical protein